MLKTKDVTLQCGRTVTITEVTVGQLLGLLAQTTEKNAAFSGLELLHVTTGLNAKDLLELTSTDMTNLWAAMEEVHAFFFKLAAALNLPMLLPALITAISQAGYLDRFLSLQPQPQTPQRRFWPGVTSFLLKPRNGGMK